MNIVNFFYYHPFFQRLFPTLVYCLGKELSDCLTVLDLGCGPCSPIKYCPNIKYSVGVEAFGPSLQTSQKQKIHTRYITSDIMKVRFPKKSFDAVVLIDVLEHLKKQDGRIILAQAQEWARKKIIVNTPNGFFEQQPKNGNPLELHQSGWTKEEMENRGFSSHGMAGWKFLRGKAKDNRQDILSTVRFWPRPLWFIILTFTQALTYYFPQASFEIFYVKKI